MKRLIHKMSKEEKNEASVVGGTKGFSAPFGAEKKKKKSDPNQPFVYRGKTPASFEESVIRLALDEDEIPEVVKKRGEHWVFYDDDTGVQLGSFSDREKAWDMQRAKRRAQKHKRELERQRKKVTVKGVEKEVSPKPKTKSYYQERPPIKLKTKKEAVQYLDKILKENFLSYVFEQTPTSNDAIIWDKFLERLSKETILSDPKLKGILEKSVKSEAILLKKSLDELKKILEGAGSFEVKTSKMEKDPKSGKIENSFDVHMKDNSKTLPFGIRLENGRPLIFIPDASRSALNSMGNDESKLLRAELMHAQETVLDNMMEVVNVNDKRNKYLRGVEKKVDKTISGMNLLEMAVLKYLIRNKYKGIG